MKRLKCSNATCSIYGRCSYPTLCVAMDLPAAPWTGPRPDETDAMGRLRCTVPPDRWPYGPPDLHDSECKLHGHNGAGSYCNCNASGFGDAA